MAYVIAEPCVDVLDKSCRQECPVDCIYEGARMLYIHPDECIDCGACELVCPSQAIFHEQDLPERWRSYAQTSIAAFADSGAPGGASSLVMPIADPAEIAGMPPHTEA